MKPPPSPVEAVVIIATARRLELDKGEPFGNALQRGEDLVERNRPVILLRWIGKNHAVINRRYIVARWGEGGFNIALVKSAAKSMRGGRLARLACFLGP